jgi:putative capsular polysaccharide synthesis protein/sulfotransferase famil protein
MSFKIKSRRFIARYLSTLVEFIYYVKIKNTNFNRAPIIILTPGKVGSSSVYDTLKNKIKNPVYHIHRFSQEGIENTINRFLNSERKSRPLHLIISKLLRKKLKNYNRDLFIITIVREPISRFISSFFQNTDLYKIENKDLQINTAKAQELLSENFDSNICGVVEDWFEKEINNNFGIDVFSKEIDNNKKYGIMYHKNYHLLLLKMEDLNAVFPKAIQEFLSLDEPIFLQNSNVGEKKHYSKAYNEVKSNIKLPKKSIEQIVNSKYFQHFYKELELKVVEKWSTKTD